MDARMALLVAPSGYGKSTLIQELAERLGWTQVFVDGELGTFAAALRRALRRAGLLSVAEALEGGAGVSLPSLLATRSDPVLFVVDDADRLDAAEAAEAAELVATLGAPHRMVIAGQSVPSWPNPPLLDARLGPAEMSFDAVEICDYAQLVERPLDSTESEAIFSATAGWPAAVTLAIEAGVTEPRALREGIGSLVDRLLAGVDEATRVLVTQLAELPLISPSVAAAVAGPKAMDRLMATGLPVRLRPDGWWVLPDPIRDVLRVSRDGAGELDELAVAGAYFDAARPRVAIDFLLGRGQYENLAVVLERRRWQELQELDAAELRSLLSVMPRDVVDAYPRLLLALARVAGAQVQLEWRAELLERAAALVGQSAGEDAELRREIDAERAGVLSLNGETEAAAALARAVLASASDGEHATRARALAALGQARAFERDPRSHVDATRYLTEALTLARLAGEQELVAATLLRLGYGVHFAAGELAAAAERLREAADATPYAPAARASTLTFLADVLIYSGNLDEADAALREVADIGRRLRDQHLLGYHAWMKAAIGSRRGDVVAVDTWLGDAERHPGDWFGHPTGIEFLADAVDMYGRLGEQERAAAYLARVAQRCAEDGHEDIDQIALLARATNGARFGDPALAEMELAAVLDTEQLSQRETWRIHLLRGYAALRRSGEVDAARHSARAFEEAAALGHPELPAVHEPTITEAVMPLARRTCSAGVSEAARTEPALAVRVLGGFAVTADGRAADPPPGRPATLVKLLAVAGGQIAADEAIEILWPEVDPEVGRPRLRNVLARIRSSCGELIRRDGSALALADGVVVDALEFSREGRGAIAESGAASESGVGADSGAALARRAAARYTGELLPADRYEDFTVTLRERLALLYVSLLDRLAAEAERAGDIDEALRLASEAIAAAPLEEHRYERAAALALANGRRQRARDVVAQAEQVLADLGVELSPELEAIAAQLDSAAGGRVGAR